MASYHFYTYLQYGGSNADEPIHRTVSVNLNNAHGYAMQGLHPDPNIKSLDSQTNASYKPEHNITSLNIITIVVDGLRADRTPGHQYPRNLMPYLSELESQKKLKIFTQARTTCAETTCSHAGLFASKFTHQLHDKTLKLQDVLKLHNYYTNFIISGDHNNFYNIRDIYGDIDEYFDGGMQKKYYINDDQIVIQKTKALPDWNNKPTMIHYHLLSTHGLGEQYPKFNKYLPQKPFSGGNTGKTRKEFINYYDNRVLQTDWVIKTLLKSLEEKHYLDKALVIITADHGDSIGEHSVYAHTNSVYEEPLRIPLIFIPYGYKSKIPDQYNQLFSIIDIAPTILHELSIPIPASWEGFPIQSTMHREYTYFIMRPNIGFYHNTPGEDLWKFWFNEITHEEFAYNITKDPKETKNLIKSAPKNLKEKWHNHHISFYKKTLE